MHDKEEEEAISNGIIPICSDATLVGSGGRGCCRQIPDFCWCMFQSIPYLDQSHRAIYESNFSMAVSRIRTHA